jgi:hypothetical protein
LPGLGTPEFVHRRKSVDEIPSSAILPAVAPLGAASPSSRAVSPASTPQTGAALKPQTGAPTPVSAPAQPAAPIGFTYSYDQSIHRMVIEARDPVSGFVVFQSPPNYVMKQFSATTGATSAPMRGSSIDNAV